MPISPTDKKRLWGLSRNRCAICGRQLVEPGGANQANIIIGEECHIVAKEVDGPRGDSPLSVQERDSFDNILLLCPSDHTKIDKDVISYTVERLKSIKNQHENFSRYEKSEYHLYFINKWENLCHIRLWSELTSNFFYSTQYAMRNSHLEGFRNFNLYVRSLPFPYFEIESIDGAFLSFNQIMCDFHNIFMEHSAQYREEFQYYRKFYKDFDYPKSDEVFKVYDFNTTILSNLLAELTKCGNLIIDRVSAEIIPSYNMNGYMMLDNSGVAMNGPSNDHYVQFYPEHIAAQISPYPGIEAFKATYSNRGYHFVPLEQ